MITQDVRRTLDTHYFRDSVMSLAFYGYDGGGGWESNAAGSNIDFDMKVARNVFYDFICMYLVI